MKAIVRLFFVVLLVSWLPACANKGKIYRGVCQGMYDGLSQQREMKDPEPIPPPGSETPTYDQYEREREEMLKDYKDQRGEVIGVNP